MPMDWDDWKRDVKPDRPTRLDQERKHVDPVPITPVPEPVFPHRGAIPEPDQILPHHEDVAEVVTTTPQRVRIDDTKDRIAELNRKLNNELAHLQSLVTDTMKPLVSRMIETQADMARWVQKEV